MSIFEKLKIKRASSKEHRVKEMSEYAYQITEYQGQLWFTFNGILFCPCKMMDGAPIEALQEMRRLYVERNK